MEFKIPDDPRSKKLLAMAAVAVLAVGAYWYMMWKPDHAEIVLIVQHADSLEASNLEIKKLVDNGEEARIKAATDRYNAELAVLRRLVPTQTEVVGLIDNVSTAARLNGMDINDFTPDGEMPGDYFNAIKYRFSVTGPYHKVAEFFTAVASMDRILVPINVNITPAPPKLERRPGKDEVFVKADFGLLTYVSKTIAPPPPAAKP